MSGLFILHLLLSGLWLVLTQSYTGLNFLFGFFIAYIVVVLFARSTGNRHYTALVTRLARFLTYFVVILFKANLQVAREVMTPGHSMKPRIFRYDVSDLTPIQTATLANTITLTPGTLSADITDDSNTLYIHAMYAEDREAAIQEIDELKHNMLRDLFAVEC